MKRKRVYDSLEQCRAKKKDDESKSASTSKEEEEKLDIDDFVESLKSRSATKTGRFHDTSLDGKPTNLKITTWNINGLRAWLGKRSGLTFLAEDDADIFCFQETKCANNKVPADIKTVQGYHCYWNGSDNGQSGVVCFSKIEPSEVTMGIGIETFDKENRTITLGYDNFYLVNAYVPNSGRQLVRLDFRMKWDRAFLEYLKKLDETKPVILCGDLNVSHHEIDIANPKQNIKTAGFTIGERDNFTRLLDSGFVDTYRFLNPDKTGAYTFWTAMKRDAREKNVGWRLDYFVLSKRLMMKLCDCCIRNEVLGSDHCPVTLYLSI